MNQSIPSPPAAPPPNPAPGTPRSRPPAVGEFAPEFTAASDINPNFRFSSLGGTWLLLVFYGSLAREDAREAFAVIEANRALFDDVDAAFYGVSTDPADQAERGLKKSLPGLRYFWDFDGAVSRLYQALRRDVFAPRAFLIDRRLRVAAMAPIEGLAGMVSALRREIALERDTPAVHLAPVLTIPRVFEPQLCRALIDYYQRQGGVPSGHMKEIGGRTLGMLDTRVKRRSDVTIEDPDLRRETLTAISYRLIPTVERFLGWSATRVERYTVACYSAAEAGFFRPHRDNTTAGTAHRKFAVSINLNAEDYEGGDLRFLEFGTRTYRPPTGGATVFSCSMLHEATPVTRGDRYAFLPFLYDEAGKRIRDANISLLGPAADAG